MESSGHRRDDRGDLELLRDVLEILYLLRYTKVYQTVRKESVCWCSFGLHVYMSEFREDIAGHSSLCLRVQDLVRRIKNLLEGDV